MNISRITMLSVALFIAPFTLAEDISVTTTPIAQPTNMFKKAGNFVAAPFVFAGTSVAAIAGKIADKTCLNTAISKITGIDCLKDTCINKPETIGKTIIIIATAAALYKAYTMYNAQDIDNDDDIFGDDEDYALNS